MITAARALPSDTDPAPTFQFANPPPAVPRAGGLAAAACCGGRFFCSVD